MLYKNFKGKRLSSLGMGCMRLPVLEGDDSKIDKQKTAEIIDYAIKNGLNYFDTAWGYHGGNSETVIGEILKSYPRDSFYLASKFPGFDVSNMSKVEEIFEQQLKKCQVEYFDFYLFHNVCESNIDLYLDRKYGVYDYLVEQKKRGRIKHLGFSLHGNCETLKRFLDAYGEELEFCQMQINYIDWRLQSADKNVEILNAHKIPVWVMEPIRGGRLANLQEDYTKRLQEARPDETAVCWAFRFIQSIPQVVVTLSGMSNFEQIKENIKTFSDNKPLNDFELSVLEGIANDMISQKTVMCTACRYCVLKCPQLLDIPNLLQLYNEFSFSNGGFLAPMRINALNEDKRPSACIACRNCEQVCPQGIKISEILSEFAEKLNKKS